MIMVSACLMGINCKYNGESNHNESVVSFLSGKPYILVCPETMGTLKVPRPPCEIKGGDGLAVLYSKARVLTDSDIDVTHEFIQGAQSCLELAKMNDITQAILKARSPSCGCGRIYDGSFSGRLIDGDGVTAAMLKQHGVQVITELEIDKGFIQPK